MIRSLLALLYIIVFLICSIPLFLVEWILGKFRPDLRDISCLRIVQWAFRCVAFIAGTRLIVRGKENIPTDEGVLFVCNHRSWFDIVFTYPQCPGRTGYIAKDGVAKVPLFSTWMRWLYCLFLDRTSIKAGVKMVQTAAEYMTQGVSIFVFPEGTRCRQKEMLPFREGSLKIAGKSGGKIVPVAITNSSAVLEDHFPYIRRSTVILSYGEPIETASLSMQEKRKLGEQTLAQIQNMLDENAKIWEKEALPREKEGPRSISNPGY